jgi:hypothetical protein
VRVLAERQPEARLADVLVGIQASLISALICSSDLFFVSTTKNRLSKNHNRQHAPYSKKGKLPLKMLLRIRLFVSIGNVCETIKLPVQMSSVAHDINLSRIIFGAISGMIIHKMGPIVPPKRGCKLS